MTTPSEIQLPFLGRTEAGCALAERLSCYADSPGTCVLGLPRGGVVVACEVAKRLHAPLDVVVVRKLALPGDPELAIGAIASGGVHAMNTNILNRTMLSETQVNALAELEFEELGRREGLYRGERPPLDLYDKCVILIDDGLATGATMRAAIQSVHRHEPSRIVIAVPVGSIDVVSAFRQRVDDVVCLATPQPFYAVGVWYEEFPQVSDHEVRAILREAWQHQTTDQLPL